MQVFQRGVVLKIMEWQYTKYFVVIKKFFEEMVIIYCWVKKIICKTIGNPNFLKTHLYDTQLLALRGVIMHVSTFLFGFCHIFLLLQWVRTLFISLYCN